MEETRAYPRYRTNLVVDFEYINTAQCEDHSGPLSPSRGHGSVVNMSLSGALIVTDVEVCAEIPVALFFKMKSDDLPNPKIVLITNGEIVRSGSIDDISGEIPPDEVDLSARGGRYIAVKFHTPEFELSNMISAYG